VDIAERGSLWIERGVLQYIRERLLPVVLPPGERLSKDCWFWVGPLDTGGRPMVYNQNKQWPVVRLLYVIQNGPLSERSHLVNTCGQPRCCRPDHFKQEARGPIARPVYTHGTMPVCVKGHPQYPQNQYIFRGKVYCRMCHADAQRRYSRARRGARKSSG